MKEKTITASCRFDCEMDIGPDASMETEEIREIYDEFIGIPIKGTYHWLDISDFINNDGQTIGEYLLNNRIKFANALAKLEE